MQWAKTMTIQSLQQTHWKLCTAYFELHTSYCALHTNLTETETASAAAWLKFDLAHGLRHTAHWISHSVSHTVHCVAHTTHCGFHTVFHTLHTAQPLYCRVLKNLIRISLKCMLFRQVPYLFIFPSSKFKCYLHGLDSRNHFSYLNLKSSVFVHLKLWCSGELYFGSAFCTFSSFPRISWTEARGDLQCFKSYIYLLIKIQHRKFELLAFRRTRNCWAGVTYNFTLNFWLVLKFWSALKI